MPKIEWEEQWFIGLSQRKNSNMHVSIKHIKCVNIVNKMIEKQNETRAMVSIVNVIEWR